METSLRQANVSIGGAAPAGVAPAHRSFSSSNLTNLSVSQLIKTQSFAGAVSSGAPTPKSAAASTAATPSAAAQSPGQHQAGTPSQQAAGSGQPAQSRASEHRGSAHIPTSTSLLPATHTFAPILTDLSGGAEPDPLPTLYLSIFRMCERGLPLPVVIPDTVVYEHHFPRAWYWYDPSAHVPVPTTQHEEVASMLALPGAIRRKPPKQCGSQAVSKAFASGFSQKAKTRSGGVCAQLVQREPDGSILVRYLDRQTLPTALQSAPAQCILSRFVPPTPEQPTHEVLVATFTTGVFSIERRIARSELADTTRTPDQRCALVRPTEYYEGHVCSLLANTVRSALHRLLAYVEHSERRRIQICKLHVKHRYGAVWLLWAESLTFVPLLAPARALRLKQHALLPPRRSSQQTSAIPGLMLTEPARGASARSGRRSASESSARSSAVRSHNYGDTDASGAVIEKQLEVVGLWPSFCKQTEPPADIRAIVDEKMGQLLLQRAKPVSPLTSPTHGRQMALAYARRAAKKAAAEKAEKLQRMKSKAQLRQDDVSRWRDAPKAEHGTDNPNFPDMLLTVSPGSPAGDQCHGGFTGEPDPRQPTGGDGGAIGTARPRGDGRNGGPRRHRSGDSKEATVSELGMSVSTRRSQSRSRHLPVPTNERQGWVHPTVGASSFASIHNATASSASSRPESVLSMSMSKRSQQQLNKSQRRESSSKRSNMSGSQRRNNDGGGVPLLQRIPSVSDSQHHSHPHRHHDERHYDDGSQSRVSPSHRAKGTSASSRSHSVVRLDDTVVGIAALHADHEHDLDAAHPTHLIGADMESGGLVDLPTPIVPCADMSEEQMGRFWDAFDVACDDALTDAVATILGEHTAERYDDEDEDDAGHLVASGFSDDDLHALQFDEEDSHQSGLPGSRHGGHVDSHNENDDPSQGLDDELDEADDVDEDGEPRVLFATSNGQQQSAAQRNQTQQQHDHEYQQQQDSHQVAQGDHRPHTVPRPVGLSNRSSGQSLPSGFVSANGYRTTDGSRSQTPGQTPTHLPRLFTGGQSTSTHRTPPMMDSRAATPTASLAGTPANQHGGGGSGLGLLPFAAESQSRDGERSGHDGALSYDRPSSPDHADGKSTGRPQPLSPSAIEARRGPNGGNNAEPGSGGLHGQGPLSPALGSPQRPRNVARRKHGESECAKHTRRMFFYGRHHESHLRLHGLVEEFGHATAAALLNATAREEPFGKSSRPHSVQPSPRFGTASTSNAQGPTSPGQSNLLRALSESAQSQLATKQTRDAKVKERHKARFEMRKRAVSRQLSDSSLPGSTFAQMFSGTELMAGFGKERGSPVGPRSPTRVPQLDRSVTPPRSGRASARSKSGRGSARKGQGRSGGDRQAAETPIPFVSPRTAQRMSASTSATASRPGTTPQGQRRLRPLTTTADNAKNASATVSPAHRQGHGPAGLPPVAPQTGSRSSSQSPSLNQTPNRMMGASNLGSLATTPTSHGPIALEHGMEGATVTAPRGLTAVDSDAFRALGNDTADVFSDGIINDLPAPFSDPGPDSEFEASVLDDDEPDRVHIPEYIETALYAAYGAAALHDVVATETGHWRRAVPAEDDPPLSISDALLERLGFIVDEASGDKLRHYVDDEEEASRTASGQQTAPTVPKLRMAAIQGQTEVGGVKNTDSDSSQKQNPGDLHTAEKTTGSHDVVPHDPFAKPRRVLVLSATVAPTPHVAVLRFTRLAAAIGTHQREERAQRRREHEERWGAVSPRSFA